MLIARDSTSDPFLVHVSNFRFVNFSRCENLHSSLFLRTHRKTSSRY